MDLASSSNRALWRPLSCFTATMRSKRVSRAFQTSPMPPAPRGATISYGPSLSPTESGIGVIYQVYLVGDGSRIHAQAGVSLSGVNFTRERAFLPCADASGCAVHISGTA